MERHELITRILVCGKTSEQTDDYASAERALMESIVAGRSDLSEDCQITTLHGRDLPDHDNKAAVDAFAWSMLDRFDQRGMTYRTEFTRQAGYSFLVIYVLSESADSSEADTDYAAAQEEEKPESTALPSGGNKDNPLGIEFKQEAYDLVARMEKLNAERDTNAVYKAGDRVKISMPLAGIPKPEETGLPHEVIMDEGHTGVILRSDGEEMVTVRWDAGKYRIYRDLDLSTMKYLDNGSLKSEGFESTIHTSYLEKTKERMTAVAGQNLLAGKSEQAAAPTQKKSSLKDLGHEAFYEEAETVEAAREKVLQRIPKSQTVLVERIIDANREYKLNVHGMDADKCQEMADKLLPDNITVIKRNTIKQYRKFKKNISAFTVDEALQLVLKDEEHITVSSLVMTEKVKPGMFGLIKKPDRYEAEVEQDEIMEIIYKHPLSRVYIRTGSRTVMPDSLTNYNDLPEIIWASTQLGQKVNGIDMKLRSLALLKEHFTVEILKTKPRNEIIEKFDKHAEELYLLDLMRFTAEVHLSDITFTDYEPVCLYLTEHFNNRLLPQINRIKNGERVVFELPLYKTFGIDRQFSHFEKWQLDAINKALAEAFQAFENFLFLRI